MPKVVAGYKEEAKRAILEAAIQVFGSKGYQGATMEDVAKKLGVSKGAVYQYFPSKDVLFLELCGGVAKKVEDMLRTNFVGASLKESAKRMMDLEFERMERREMLMFEALAEAPRNKALEKVMRDNYSASQKVLADFLEGLKRQGRLKKEVDSVKAARFLMALRSGVLVSALQGLDKDEAKRVWVEGLDSILSHEGT